MTLKQDLIRRGYLPENLPPSFNSDLVGSYFEANSSGYLSARSGRVRAAIYNASKRGMSRRAFSVIHPVTTHDLAEFIESRKSEIDAFFATSNFSLSVPRHTPDGDRAIEIATHGELEEERLTRLSGFRFIAKTDISRFYHSVYTHAIPWAYHGRAAAKKDTETNSNNVFFNRLDYTLRQGQDGQTIGIPVGPDAARYIAEVIATAIDRDFSRRCDIQDVAVIRHVDDVWIGAHTHADAEGALWRYRESLREFELDVNENKT